MYESYNYYRRKYVTMEDNTFTCTKSFSIKNPPEKPTLISPEDNYVFYYPESEKEHKPDFSWDKVYHWGWSTNYATKTYSFSIEGVGNPNRQNFIVSDGEYDRQFEISLKPNNIPDGKYKWSVSSNYDGMSSLSDPRHFEICTAKSSGDVKLLYPAKDDIITNKDIEFSWEEPASWSYCGEKSKYYYILTVRKGMENYNVTRLSRGNNKLVISIVEDDTYMWDVKAYGPLGLVSEPTSVTFSFCTPTKSNPPHNLRLNKDPINSCAASDGDIQYEFSWDEPKDFGKSCKAEDTKITNYKVILCSDGTCTENITNVPMLNKSIQCSSKSYSISISAWNEHEYSEPLVGAFDVCQKSIPAKPEFGEIQENYCSPTTEIKWKYNGWGEACQGSKEEKKFIFVFSNGTTMQTENVSYHESNDYTHDFSLGKGEWKMEVKALNKDGMLSAAASQNFIASEIPNVENFDIQNLGNELKIKFSWETNDKFLNCAANKGFQYKLEYDIDGKESSEVFDIKKSVEYNIPISEGFNIPIVWSLKVVGPEEILLENGIYRITDDCVDIKPKWSKSGDILKTPGKDVSVFGTVEFSWEEASPGIACVKEQKNTKMRRSAVDTGAKRGYYIYVDKIKIGESTTNSYKTELDTTGNHEWYVEAFVGDVVSNPTETRSFCLGAQPQVPVAHNYNPFNPNVVSWENVTCKSFQFQFLHKETFFIS